MMELCVNQKKGLKVHKSDLVNSKFSESYDSVYHYFKFDMTKTESFSSLLFLKLRAGSTYYYLFGHQVIEVFHYALFLKIWIIFPMIFFRKLPKNTAWFQ